jgi:hypothetical protein
MRSYQQTMELNTLYACNGDGVGDGDCLQPFIEIVGGTATVYGCVERPNNPPDDMAEAIRDGVTGIINFAVIPNFMYVTQASGSITSIILSGVEAEEATTA